MLLLGCASCGTTAAVVALPEAAPPVKVAEPAELESDLGYRGFVVRMTPSESGLVTLQRGVVHVSGEGYYRDEDRELERRLLDTGEFEMEPEIADLVEDELT